MIARFGDLRLVVLPGVYRPRSDTALLAEHLTDVEGASVLELCGGSGALALTAATRGAARVVAVDRCARAVATMRINGRLNGLPIDVRRGDLMGPLRDDERFDVIVANPPYVPVAPGAGRLDPRWDAGHDGRDVLDRIVDGAEGLLAPDGRLLLVQSDVADSDATCERLAARGLGDVRRSEHVGPLGPILEARRAHLVRLGRLDADSPRETLTVLSARAAA